MSDTLSALLILPTLAALVLVLECSRIGCTKVVRFTKKQRKTNVASTAAVLD